MNDFTKEELEILFHWGLDRAEAIGLKNFQDEGHDKLCIKLKHMIRNYSENAVIGTGNLLFYNKESSSGILPKINEQIYLCKNEDGEKYFIINWKILQRKI